MRLIICVFKKIRNPRESKFPISLFNNFPACFKLNLNVSNLFSIYRILITIFIISYCVLQKRDAKSHTSFYSISCSLFSSFAKTTTDRQFQITDLSYFPLLYHHFFCHQALLNYINTSFYKIRHFLPF